MRRVRFLFSLPLSLVVLCAVSSALQAQDHSASEEPVKVKMNLVIGGQTRITTGDRWTHFMLYRDVPKNFTLQNLDFSIARAASRWSLTGSAEQATQFDQRYRLSLEEFGRLRTDFRFDGFSQTISRGAVLASHEARPGFFVLPEAFRGALRTAPDSATPALVEDLLRSAEHVDVGTRREVYRLDQEFIPRDDWKIFWNFMREHRSGRKPTGLGTYERVGTPSGGFFRVLGQELVQPANYRTTSASAGVSYQRERIFLQGEYTASWFHNRVDALRWQNPFSAVDEQASTPAGAANRWFFATGQLDLFPDNTAHTLTFQGKLQLPRETFLSSVVSWSRRTQNDPFLPWTLNTAVTEGVPAGIRPTDPSSLPRSSLGGRVELFNSDVAIGTRKWDELALTARYRSYDYDNQTPRLVLPGYVGFGDGFWRTSFSGVNLPDLHRPSSYLRQRASVEAAWRPAEQFQLKVEPTWEGWNRTNRQVNRTNEWGARGQILYEPLRWVNARATYQYGLRRPGPYNAGLREFSGLTSGVAPGDFRSGLRMFDQARRVQNIAGLVLNFVSNTAWQVSATYDYRSDHYDQNFFGAGSYLQGNAGVDVSFAPSDRYGIVAYYNRDQIRHHYRSIAKGAGDFTWALDNEWDRDTRDRVDTFGIGLNLIGGDEGRAHMDLSYDLSFAGQRGTTQNPFTPRADGRNDALANAWPDIESHFHQVRFEAGHRFLSNVEAGLNYLFEPYRLSDFAWDIMRPYMFGAEAAENDARRFLFLNSRYGSASAHVVSVYVKYSF